MSVVIRDLVDLTEMEAGCPLALKLEPLDLRAFLLGLVKEPAGVLASPRLRIEAPEGLPRVLADPDRLERILTNLLSNALKYSAPNTEVTLSLSLRQGEVVTPVSDQGLGIPLEERPVLFGPIVDCAWHAAVGKT